jgi:RNA methyltransferase, TrmH family
MKQITSLQNPLVKEVLILQEKAKARKKSGLFIIEGLRELELAIKGKYEIETILFCNQIATSSLVNVTSSGDDVTSSLVEKSKAEKIEITKEIYQKLAYRDSTEGIIALAKSKSHDLSNSNLPKNPLILVLEKPGNIGAILRTADAANIDLVIIADPKTDLYNPNLIRSSVGCIFTNKIAVASSEEAIDFLKQSNYNIYCATLQDSAVYYQENFNQPTALVLGTEATGITEIWRKNSTKNINIPMEGKIDSMNVSVAAAILVFEAKRQRSIKH